MKKNPQYNQQDKYVMLKKYVFTKTWKVAVTLYLKLIVVSMLCQKESHATISERRKSHSEIIHSVKSAFMFTIMQPR